MNKKHLCSQIALKTGLDQETVRAVLDSLESVVIEVLKSGDQLHWDGFLRAWTVLKRPTLRTGQYIYKDKLGRKVRYLFPDCRFCSPVVNTIKEEHPRVEDKTQASEQVGICLENSAKEGVAK